ncbi:hypothetical protein ACFFYR_35925 [Paraburkholderia dipogonis]|uniref:hypothetical protein n=1 Tax=Paraburkholderia dipogonis TaxID=1211383 RepID=UPI001FCABD56|nr:hypothetical protein [Paraburkholderia dipogonis]
MRDQMQLARIQLDRIASRRAAAATGRSICAAASARAAAICTVAGIIGAPCAITCACAIAIASAAGSASAVDVVAVNVIAVVGRGRLNRRATGGPGTIVVYLIRAAAKETTYATVISRRSLKLTGRIARKSS